MSTVPIFNFVFQNQIRSEPTKQTCQAPDKLERGPGAANAYVGERHRFVEGVAVGAAQLLLRGGPRAAARDLALALVLDRARRVGAAVGAHGLVVVLLIP